MRDIKGDRYIFPTPGRVQLRSVRPNGPSDPRTTRETKTNCWPVGPANDVVGGTFPGPLGRAGGTAGPLGRRPVAVRGSTVRTTSRSRPTQPALRGGGPLCPLRWAFVGRPPSRWAENQSGSARPPSAGRPSEPTVRLGPETGGRGGGPPCPLRRAFVGRQPRGGAGKRPGSARPRRRGGVRIAPCTGNPLGVRVVCHPEEPRGRFALTPRPEAERVEQERVEGEIREAEETARKKRRFRPHPSPLPRARGLCLA
jgi:hypothetical protein